MYTIYLIFCTCNQDFKDNPKSNGNSVSDIVKYYSFSVLKGICPYYLQAMWLITVFRLWLNLILFVQNAILIKWAQRKVFTKLGLFLESNKAFEEFYLGLLLGCRYLLVQITLDSSYSLFFPVLFSHANIFTSL